MIRPQKMKQLEMSVLERDVDQVIEFLGRSALMHFSDTAQKTDQVSNHLDEYLVKIQDAAAWLNITVPTEPEEASRLPEESDHQRVEHVLGVVDELQNREAALNAEHQKITEALHEVQSFSKLDAPFAEFDQLSYLTLRFGRLEPQSRKIIEENMAGRAVLLSLGEGDRIVAATSRNGRFALDSELKDQGFTPMTMPKDFHGVPAEMLSGLETKYKEITAKLNALSTEKESIAVQYTSEIRELAADYLLASMVQDLKEKLVSTKSTYYLSGWVPANSLLEMVNKIEAITNGRVAVRSFDPEEIPAIRNGTHKVPVSLKHGSFIKGFEPLILSYGAPAYGTIDPTPFVAVFFAILFGIMFGDVGQGLILFLLGFLIDKRKITQLKSFKNYAIPLKTVGIASMIMGFLYGTVFSNEQILVAPTRAITGLLTGNPIDKILHLMPEGDNMTRVFLFFGFTVALGVILNSVGLIINIINQLSLKHYESALFSRSGIAGTLFFWYAIFIAVRIILGGTIGIFDIVCLLLPVFFIACGPVLWRLIAKEKPLFKEGFVGFIVEGIVEILETISGYLSNTVSFLRVGAFALSHVVLSFIVFTMVEKVSGVPLGALWGFIVAFFGNLIIILLEGMIVAIQVVRLQYYEFFSKFFSETGIPFSPFRFRKD
ncbi:MAG: V-type ATP synthase subunit I [Treponema sp.]|jgi:V/A-type H+-transporting ATPase subunit I|nr:V-type ATP synthase subunit I [Treponema sp.]